MLVELRIVDLGVIGEASIEPSPGFTVVTGETGAGKTMIVTGLTLLSGAKAAPALIRSGASRALVEGRWLLSEEEAAEVLQLGAEVELIEGAAEVLVGRQLTSSRSRMMIGGVQMPLTQGAEVIADWVTIHGQLEQVRLGTEQRQREVLDAWAKEELASELAAYQEAFALRRSLKSQLRELTEQTQARARELDLLRFGLDEIAKVDPQPAEDVALAMESKKLQQVDDLRIAANSALVALAGEESSYDELPDALSLVGVARKSLTGVASDDLELSEIATQLADSAASLADAASGLAGYLTSLEADPIRLEWIAGRRAELQTLTRKYGASIDEVLAWAQDAVQRVAELDSSDERVAVLQAQVSQLDDSLTQMAARITQIRQRTSKQLVAAAQQELAALAMPNARLQFQITPSSDLGAHGGDQVQLLFSANPGTEPGSLAKMASGGELSRVRLALEVVLAGSGDGAGTFVFDEVDAGVGGKVALEIGRRLQRLAKHSQVIVVTHLAQVAAFADKHFVVSKSDDGKVTVSNVKEVQGEARLDTLAHMMGGLDSTAGIDHARELLALAQEN